MEDITYSLFCRVYVTRHFRFYLIYTFLIRIVGIYGICKRIYTCVKKVILNLYLIFYNMHSLIQQKLLNYFTIFKYIVPLSIGTMECGYVSKGI